VGNYEIQKIGDKVTEKVYTNNPAGGSIVKTRPTTSLRSSSDGEAIWSYNYYYTDYLGSTRFILTDKDIEQGINPENITKYTYYAYGNPVDSLPAQAGSGVPQNDGSVILSASEGSHTLNAQTLPTEDTYTGQKKDEETGLMYYNARYYDPTLGLFIQADSVDDGLNKYQYVRNNPINATDPSGHWCVFGKFGSGCRNEANRYRYGTNTEFDSLRERFSGHNPVEVTNEDLSAISKAFAYYPQSFTDAVQFQFTDGYEANCTAGESCSRTNAIAYVWEKEPNHINLNISSSSLLYMNWDTFNFSENDKVGTVIHELIHVWQHNNLSDFSDQDGNNFNFQNFNRYVSIVENQGINLKDTSVVGLRLLADPRGDGDPFASYRKNLDIPKTLQKLIKSDSYGTKNIYELGAVLGEIYTNQDSPNTNATAQDFKDLWPEMYEFYKNEIFGGKEFLPDNER